MTNSTSRQSNLIPFRPGQSGNPGGRPVGARNRLQADFLHSLADHFAENGKDAIDRACKKDPLGYIRAVASLMPKQIEAADPFEGIDDTALRALLAVIKTARCARNVDDGLEPG